MLNVFAIIIVAALLFEFVVDAVADALNLRALRLPVPAELQGLYPPEQYRRSQEYTRAATRFGFISHGFRLVLVLAFWFAGGFGYLEQVVRGWGLTLIPAGLVYIGILVIAQQVLMLPFAIYAIFGLEARFGFNKTTPRTFIMDNIKGLLLSVLLGAPLLAAVLALFEYGGGYAWAYCWAAVTIVSLVVQFVAPIWIMPLFNRFTPMPPGEIREAILSYAKSVDFPVNKVFVMDGSRRSARGNAFFTGFGRNRRIALFDTLIAKHTTPELVAVLAHEIGHYKKKHILLGMALGVIHTGIIFYLLSVFLGSPGLYRAFLMPDQPVYAGLLFFGLLYTPVELVLSVLLQMLSRRNESQADRFAADTIAEPQHLADALKKLSRDNLSNLTPHPFYVFLHYSHPPLKERVCAIKHG